MASYVRSKCMDTGTDEGIAPSTGLNFQNYSVCDFDSPNVGTASFNYELPFGTKMKFLSNAPHLVNSVVGGWRLSSVFTGKSGLPFTPTISGDVANIGETSQRPELVGTPFVPGNVNCWFYTSANSSCKALYPTATNAYALPTIYTYGNSGRNTLRAQPLYQLDMSLNKVFSITESKRLEFRAEVFNLFNHPVFAIPGTNIDQSSGGQVTSTLNSDRIIEFSLKLFF
jgi:hypothetical protein